MTTNPSHILIARNSRGPNNPSASLSSPTETHAAAAGIFRSSGSPPWLLEECETDDIVSELSLYDDDEAIDIEDSFTKNSRFPGTVKIIVESTTFWAHKEVLFFASPFFEAALSGSWLETGRPPSMSSVITISQPPSIPGDKRINEVATEMTFAPVDPDELDSPMDLEKLMKSESDASDAEDNEPITERDEDKVHARNSSLAKLQGADRTKSDKGKQKRSSLDENISAKKTLKSNAKRRGKPTGHDAVIVLKEERASTFHDFLKFVYPHLECTITWNNVEGLMNISHKLCVPTLQRECLTFLLTHAAGKPIKAMRIAELFEEEELYRESSRFVLDNPGGWSEHELSTLSQDTLLKLEKRRNWFLERVLKLGLTPLAKEYQCCSTCPDPGYCARQLEEKWRQAYNAVFRFGPCQPSMVYRYLRNLEGINPPLSLTYLTCQTTAKAFTATLFDRMFSLGVRSGADMTPLGARVAAVAGAVAGPRRHFLFCTLKPEKPVPRPRRSRELL
ncbi:hypothetical protein SERLA73DRAFT_179921 [Serpula lacrymans var. lacrymans S7.3]|uniref:BTB domain-containing protein n=2 Tax=Serpula lacrymans var. lacrymans TaxID=341189 RepID=F8PUY0_SERL3|nr:uncharacterized protein SERLADRAFT_465275 [Serpula lacrymans var. lacrymans S7.9]EGN99744.1 hypothetical protein SERLA73DRAFT_179921 [Serpula lacrymans var. lacrymans S7.3]EGO25318.1 hypothetical protein SERLADRAFT_465275 [Serpula lacrymans var. lacrymans S7.9]